jgi:TatD DNase family protein
MIQLIDIHTHCYHEERLNSILSHSALDAEIPDDVRYVSLSIHPWYLTQDNISFQLQYIKNAISIDKRVVAVGECGIDKVCDTPLGLQMEVFEEAATLARDNHLPLIIHSVKSSNEIIQLRKKIGEDSIWIMHGFRGKKELASEYIRHNINLSFCEKYNTEALVVVPLNKIFLETDESKLSIDEIAAKIASDYGVSVEKLKKEVAGNISRCFPFIGL